MSDRPITPASEIVTRSARPVSPGVTVDPRDLLATHVAYRCLRCGISFTASAGVPLEKLVHPCRNPPNETTLLTCRHLGDRLEGDFICGGCGGGQFATFYCQAHKKAAIPFLSGKRRIAAAQKQGLLMCERCPDFTSG